MLLLCRPHCAGNTWTRTWLHAAAGIHANLHMADKVLLGLVGSNSVASSSLWDLSCSFQSIDIGFYSVLPIRQALPISGPLYMLYTLSGMFFSPLLTWINFIHPSDLCSNITSSWQPPWTSPTKKILCIICFHSTDHVHPSIWWWTTDVSLACYNITSMRARILSVFIHQHYDHSAHCFLLQFPDLDHLGNGYPHTRKMKMKLLILRTTLVGHWAGGRRWDGWSSHYLVRNVSPGCKLRHGFVLFQNVIDLHTILSTFKGLRTQFYSALCLFLVGVYECPPFTTLLTD